MNTEFVKGLVVLAFLAFGTVAIACVMSWAIRHLGAPKYRRIDQTLAPTNSAKQQTKGMT